MVKHWRPARDGPMARTTPVGRPATPRWTSGQSLRIPRNPPRSPAYGVPVLEVQDVRIDPETRQVWRRGEEVVLSRKEFDLLLVLMCHAGEVVTRDQLMRTVWNTTFWTSSKTIDVHLGWIRRKLGDDARSPSLITTIRGEGLRFERESVST